MIGAEDKAKACAQLNRDVLRASRLMWSASHDLFDICCDGKVGESSSELPCDRSTELAHCHILDLTDLAKRLRSE
jgi:hypothetical protein